MRIVLAIVIFFVVGALCGPFDAEIMNLFSQEQTGEGTYYGASTGGSCTLDSPTPPSGSNQDIRVAINSPQYYGSAACGMCMQMTGDGVGSGADPIDGTFIVFVDNICPECSSGDLDLGESGDGRWDISWIAVPCPGSIGNLQYMGQGSNPFYVKLQVRNHVIPVSEMTIFDNGAYQSMTRTTDNFFEYNAAYPGLSGTLDIRVTAVDGQVVDDQVSLNDITSGQPFNGNGVQFDSPNQASPDPSVTSAASSSSTRTPSPTRDSAVSTSSTRTPSPTRDSAVSTSSTRTPSSTRDSAVSSTRTPSNTPDDAATVIVDDGDGYLSSTSDSSDSSTSNSSNNSSDDSSDSSDSSDDDSSASYLAIGSFSLFAIFFVL